MTDLQEYAKAAMQGTLANGDWDWRDEWAGKIAERSFFLARAMVAESKKPENREEVK